MSAKRINILKLPNDKLQNLLKTVYEIVDDSGFTVLAENEHKIAIDPFCSAAEFQLTLNKLREQKVQELKQRKDKLIQIRAQEKLERKNIKDDIKALETKKQELLLQCKNNQASINTNQALNNTNQTSTNNEQNRNKSNKAKPDTTLTPIQLSKIKTELKQIQAKLVAAQKAIDNVQKTEREELEFETIVESVLTIRAIKRPHPAFGNSLALQMIYPEVKEAAQQEKLYMKEARQNTKDFRHPLLTSDDRLVVFFCNLSGIGVKAFQMLKRRIDTTHVRNAIFISENGCKRTPAINNSLIPNDPRFLIRVYAFEDLLVNMIKYFELVPKYTKLSAEEIEILQRKYGDLEKIPKLAKSKPVCKYYGFEAGQIVEVNFTGQVYCSLNGQNRQNEQNGTITTKEGESSNFLTTEDAIIEYFWRQVVEE